MDAVVGAADVRKAYGSTVALRGVSLSVAAGEVVALIGPNGAGKTTLVRCLTGTTTPDDGELQLLGHPPHRADANRIGLLPQAFTPPDRLTPRELLSYYAGLYDRSKPIEAVLEQVGIGPAADRAYRRLSGGQRRRTLVGTALVNDPDVLFLDEPTTGIDPAGRRAVWSLVDALANGGTTVILTTHSMDEAARLADRVGVLVDGELITIGTPAELIAAHGGSSRLVIETGDPSAAVAALEAVEGRAIDRGVVVDSLPAHRIGAVIETLDTAGVNVERVSWSEPDLERVYLELAGEELRAAGGLEFRAEGPQP